MSADKARWDKAIRNLNNAIQVELANRADDKLVGDAIEKALRERLVPLLEQFDKILFLTGDHVSGETAKAARLEIAKWR